MAKKKKHIIEIKFKTLKTKFKANELSTEEIDELTRELLDNLAILTEKSVKDINGTSIDLYKDRVWWIVEKAGLLPEYRDNDDEDNEVEMVDNYYEDDDEFGEVEIDDSKFYQ